MSELFDTHCHVHEIETALTPVHDKWHGDNKVRTAESVLEAAHAAGITRLIVIGTTLEDSQIAADFAAKHENVWAAIGLHPHEAKNYSTPQKTTLKGLSSKTSKTRSLRILPEVSARFQELITQPKVVAVGECGLDYFYEHSPKADQEVVLRFQMELALEHDLPISFHVREAFDDFWRIFESYKGVRGVLHSFTDSLENMERAIECGLYIGVNGIATFTKDETQLVTYRTIPQRSLLLETDAPFLTPKPFRGTICEPKHIVHTAEFLAELRGESLDTLATTTSANAERLFL